MTESTAEDSKVDGSEHSDQVDGPNSNHQSVQTPQQASCHVAIPSNKFVAKLHHWLSITILSVTIVVGVVSSVFISPIVGIIICLCGIIYVVVLPLDNLLKSFANANGFNYQVSGQVPEQTGVLFFIGGDGDFEDVVSGTYDQWPFFIFTYRYTILESQNPVTYARTVFTINFFTPMPAFFLRKHHHLSYTEQNDEVIQSFGYTQLVELEGDFSNHLQLYIRPDTQDDVLAVLTPDLMSLLVNLDTYEIEMSAAGDFYVYSSHLIKSRQELMNLFSIIENLAAKIGHEVNQTQLLIGMKGSY